MEIGRWIQQAKEIGTTAYEKTASAVGAGAGYVSSTVGTLKLFGSTESSTNYDAARVDEKHYFLVPNKRTAAGYSLYSMRCLPEGVPPINDLPKHRLIHLPNPHAAPILEDLLKSEARSSVDETVSDRSFGDRLTRLADDLDKIDGKIFNGVLLIGGLVALINPVAGAAVAAKALIPSVGMLASKYGLKYVGDAANSRDIAQRIKNAEKEVLKQFKGSSTRSLTNPVLAQLDKALRTTEEEFEPVLEFDSESFDFGPHDRDRLLTLTYEAISNTYDDIIKNREQWEAAHLGPEDIRYLKLIRELANHS